MLEQGQIFHTFGILRALDLPNRQLRSDQSRIWDILGVSFPWADLSNFRHLDATEDGLAIRLAYEIFVQLADECKRRHAEMSEPLPTLQP